MRTVKKPIWALGKLNLNSSLTFLTPEQAVDGSRSCPSLAVKKTLEC